MKIKKIKFSIIALSLLIGSVNSAQADPLKDLDLTTYSQSLESFVTQKKHGWFTYQIPAAPNTTSMCCYNKGNKSVCDLNKNSYGYGSSSTYPETENIHVFVNLKRGKVKQIMPVGDYCEVKAENLQVDQIIGINNQQSIQWLKDVTIKSKGDDHHSSLYALSLHPSPAAAALNDLAIDQSDDYSEQAVFWLGQRKSDGFQYLKSLLNELPTGEVRRKINFALSQNQTAEAVQQLQQIATQDQDLEQQEDAIFWLSQTDGLDSSEFLVSLINNENNFSIKEKAIFSLSQLNTEAASQQLFKLANDHHNSEVREKALFWLAQKSPDKAQKVAVNVLESSSVSHEQENAVFILSQLPNKQSSSALFKIVKGDYPRNIKKKALIWLSQSDDAQTLKELENLL